MVLAACTGQLLIDLDDSGDFATNLGTLYWKREGGIQLRGRGRNKEHDAAGSASLIGALDNRDGRFSPKKTAGAYSPNWTAYKQAKVKQTFNAVTHDIITGILTEIKVDSSNRQQLCEFVIRDYMFVLLRTDIRRPLMRDQFTGVIIDRLLDDVEGAEDREWCTNTRFETDTTGWSTQNANLTRMTGDDKILEGGASGRVNVSVGLGRATHSMTGKEGLKGALAVYVKPERDADIGATVQVVMRDNSGTVATGTATAMDPRDKWTRLSVTGTYNGGSSTQFIDVQAPVGGTQFRIGACHAVPFVNAFARNIDPGQSRLNQYSYVRGPALQAVQEVRSDEGLAMFRFEGDGTAVFEDRHHRFKDDHISTTGTFDERGILDYSESADDRIKEVIIDYPHYVDGEAGTVFWELDKVVPLPVGETTRIEADYGGGLMRDTITPVAGTDFAINSAGDGTGTSLIGSTTFTFLDFGAGSEGRFTPTVNAYLRSYRVRGTPVKLAEHKTPARYTATSGPALAATMTHEFRYNGCEPSATALAEYFGLRYSTQRERLTITLKAPFPNADITTSDMVPILARQVSDKVTIVNNNLPFATFVNGHYYIDSIDLRCTGESMEATWRLSPVDASYYIIGDSVTGTLVMAP